MVAMGSSLADRAWGRESAVYRITGVLTVISGWFITAFVAFTVAALVALTLMYGGIYAVVGLVGLVVFLFIQFFKIHKKREKNDEEAEVNIEHDIVLNCTQQIEESVEKTIEIYSKMLDGLFNEDRKGLMKLYKVADEFHGKSKRRRAYEVLPTLQRLDHNALDTGQYYVQAIDYFYEISISLRYMTESSYEFINNNHEGFSKEQIADLKLLGNELLLVYQEFIEMIKNNNYSGLEKIKERRGKLLDLYSELVKNQIKRTKDKETGTRNSILYLSLLNETKVITMKSINLMRAQMNLFNSDEYNFKK
jgi:Na+/phosphate symporter